MSPKMFTSAPLPFVGQKRMFAKHYIKVLEENIPNDGEGWEVIDAFGGSGLLSHIAKRIKPKARVIFNDFDGYAEQIAHIDEINQLRRIIYDLVKDIPKQKRIDEKTKENIVQAIEKFDGFKSPHILSSWLLFSGRQVRSLNQIYPQDFWNCVRQSDYPKAESYLDGIEVVSESFEVLLPRFKHNPQSLFVLDPPYLCTKQESYKQQTYFDLISFLELIEHVRPPFLFFFSSTKSEILKFLAWSAKKKKNNYQSFENAELIQVEATLNKNSNYQDNLIYKFH